MTIPLKKMVMPLLLVLIAVFVGTSANENKRINDPFVKDSLEQQCEIENTSFSIGEEFVFKIYYNWNFVWLSAGEVVFKVEDEGDQYHVSAHGRTYRNYEWFFTVSDKYDSYIDKETLLPQTSIRDIQEGKYTLYDKITFDQSTNTATSLRGKTKDTAETTTYNIESCMHDVLSIVYFARNLDFEGMTENNSIPIKVFVDKETWPLKVKYLGQESKKKIKGLGKFDTYTFSPEVIVGNIFNEGTQMKVWVSKDENKLPLLIESPVSVGSVKAVLKEYKGLRHELTAKR